MKHTPKCRVMVLTCTRDLHSGEKYICCTILYYNYERERLKGIFSIVRSLHHVNVSLKFMVSMLSYVSKGASGLAKAD